MQHNQSSISKESLGRAIRLLWVVLLAFCVGWQSMPVQAALGADAACPGGAHCTFVPFVIISSVVTDDLALNSVQATQAVQDSQNSVPMVAGRPTVLRIFATTRSATQVLANAQIQVTATRDGAALSGSPTTFKSSVPLSNDLADYDSTINLKLPDSWLSGTVDLTVALDPEDLISELDEQNNTLSLHLVFKEVPPLNLVIVPIQYTHLANGVTYPAPSVDTISDWMMRVYPVSQLNVTWHSPYSFTGDLRLSSDWYTLLDDVTSLKSSEGAPSSTVYYGLIPITVGSSTWFTGGIAGIGWVGSRAAVGLDMTSTAATIAAHEVGHNLGMWHSPCGTPSAVDPDYPYASGTIGQYGLDVTSGVVYSPGSNRDLMSYCYPRWISDYTYTHLMQSQIQYGASQQATLSSPIAGRKSQRSLLVRAQIDGTGARLLPLYVFHAQQNENPPVGDYQVQLWGTDGKLLSEMAVQANVIDMDGAQSAGIHALVPLPAQVVASVRLVKDGVTIAERALRNAVSTGTSVEISPAGDKVLVHWDDSTSPALLRYTADGGESWTTLGVDLRGSDFSVSSNSLPVQGGDFEVILADTWN